MPKQFVLDSALQLDELASYHQDVVASLRLYFNPSNPAFAARFLGCRPDEVKEALASHLEETDVRSAFFVLTKLEASFRIDFYFRCEKRLKDDLSTYFRNVLKLRKHKTTVRFDEDILEGWKRHTSGSKDIAALRGALKFRHWLAHGRYWNPKLGRKYNFRFRTPDGRKHHLSLQT
jgi:hypothetical protein